MESKFALVLQYWGGDRSAACHLIETLAGLESEPRSDVHFVVVHRFDSEPPTEGAKRALESKFPSHSIVRNKPHDVGHPDGCNGLWKASLEWLHRNRAIHGSEFALTFEADCFPLVTNWIDRLRFIAEAHREHLLIGRYLGGVNEHINGNLIVNLKHPGIPEVLKFRIPKGKPWDVYGYQKCFKGLGCAGVEEIVSEWRSRHVPPEHLHNLVGAGAVFHHGCKDSSVERWARLQFASAASPARFDRSDRLFRYRDEVPSAFQQGFPGAIIDLPREDSSDPFTRDTSKNGSACGELLAYRRQTIHFGRGQQDEPSRIWMRSRGEVWQIDLPAAENDHLEDPRLFRSRDRLMMSYVVSRYRGQKLETCAQRLVQLTDDGRRVTKQIPLEFGKNDLRPGNFEKNWTLIPTENSAWFVHRLDNQFVAVDVYSGRVRRASIPQPVYDWRKRYGIPRGGTPTVRTNLGHLSFFHSHLPHPVAGRRYFVGAVAFDPEDNNFRISAFSPEPILTGSFADGLAWDLASGREMNPLVVFPGSVELSSDRRNLMVTSGLNDHSVCWHSIPSTKLFHSLKR